MIWLLLACQAKVATSDWLPETWSGEEESTRAESLNDSMLNPAQMVLQEDSFWIIDEDSGELLSIDLDGNLEVLDDYLGAPTLFDVNDDVAIIYDSENQQLLKYQQGNHTAFSSNNEELQIADLLLIDSELFWLDETDGSLKRQGINENTSSTVLEYLNSPVSLTYANNTIWIACQGDKSIWSYTPSIDYAEEVAILDDYPHQMAWTDGTLWVTTRSHRWPYGGWIVSITGDTVTKVVNSPPEGESIVAADNTVYWASKQSITKYTMGEETYEMLASQTAAVDLYILNDTLFWLDAQQGALYSHSF